MNRCCDIFRTIRLYIVKNLYLNINYGVGAEYIYEHKKGPFIRSAYVSKGLKCSCCSHMLYSANCYDYLSHDMIKPTKWVRPVKTQISLGIRPVWSESSLSAWRNIGSLATHWANAQADLNLLWGHTHFVGFVMSWLILLPCFMTFNKQKKKHFTSV